MVWVLWELRARASMNIKFSMEVQRVFIQLYFEGGLLLALSFLFFYIWAISKCYKNNSLQPLGSILIVAFFVIISTPAFYGFVNSFWLWAILIYVASWRKA